MDNIITVLGKLQDTAQFVGKPGYNVLQVESSDWSPEFNTAWLKAAVQRGDSFLLVSVKATGQYANELQQLISQLIKAAK